MNRINQPSEQQIGQFAKNVLDAKLRGALNTPQTALSRAFQLLGVTKVAYLELIDAIEKGLMGQATPEDLQRCHELKALLEDLP